MKLFDLISMTLRNPVRRKTRTMLTITGVIVGTCSIVIMVSMGLGMTQSMEEQIAGMGDLTQIQVYNYGNNPDAEALDDKAIERIQAIDGVVAATPFWQGPEMNLQLRAGRKDRYQIYGWNIVGVYPDALEAMGFEVEEGTLLQPSTGKKINLLFGSEAAYQFEDTKRSWRNSTVSPYPQEDGTIPDPFVDVMNDKMTLQLESSEMDDNGDPKYRTLIYDVNVNGVMKKRDSNGYDQNSYRIFIDIKDLQKMYKEYKKVNNIKSNSQQNSGQQNEGAYNEVYVKVRDIDTVSQVNEAIQELGYETSSLDSIREPMQKQMQSMQLFLGGLGAVSLVVAAIGITNTMIMSIYERTREIGVMKVLGCKLGNIRTIFLMEAGLIGLLGGVLGIGISVGFSKIINHVVATGGGGNDSFLSMLLPNLGMGMGGELSVIPVWLAASGIGFATLVGLVSGFYPANRAVKISALEAIKHE